MEINHPALSSVNQSFPSPYVILIVKKFGLSCKQKRNDNIKKIIKLYKNPS